MQEIYIVQKINFISLFRNSLFILTTLRAKHQTIVTMLVCALVETFDNQVNVETFDSHENIYWVSRFCRSIYFIKI